MNPNAKMLAIDALPANETTPYCRRWGIALILGSLASWALVITAARIIAGAV
ncbi:MAG TPA: hypothetical protein VL993_18620 [Stellaceae bacterium]|nr:hypothetical protein [Stellaceae bacterium]